MSREEKLNKIQDVIGYLSNILDKYKILAEYSKDEKEEYIDAVLKIGTTLTVQISSSVLILCNASIPQESPTEPESKNES